MVGDVCGKGAPAAAVTGLARYTLRAAVIQERLPSRVLAFLNDAIRRQRPSEFCSVALARLELNGAAGATATLSNGGHPLPLVLRSTGAVESIGSHGTLLGVADDPELSDTTVELHPGDSLVLYTDGLTDAYAPARIFTPADLVAALAPCGGLPAADITGRVTHDAARRQRRAAARRHRAAGAAGPAGRDRRRSGRSSSACPETSTRCRPRDVRSRSSRRCSSPSCSRT